MLLLRQAIWGHIWKRTLEKNKINATNATMHLIRQAVWGDIWKIIVYESKTMQPMCLWIFPVMWFEDTFEKVQWANGKQMQLMRLCIFQASNLRRHLKTHSGEKSNKYNLFSFMIKIQINPSSELQSVPANLTVHMMSKIEFQPDFLNRQMLSFPNMYNTMRSKMDGLAVREHFLSKIAEKTAF